jgi:hypothetical protein
VVLPLVRRGVLAPRDRLGLLPEDDRWFTILLCAPSLARFDCHKLQVTPLPETGGCDPPAAHDWPPIKAPVASVGMPLPRLGLLPITPLEQFWKLIQPVTNRFHVAGNPSECLPSRGAISSVVPLV